MSPESLSTNAHQVCIHPLNRRISDFHEGTEVCMDCAYVIEEVMYNFPPVNYFTHQENSTNTFIDKIVTNNHISPDIRDKAILIKKDILNLLPKKPCIDIGIYSLFTASILLNNPYSIEEIANISGLSTKHTLKKINSITKLSQCYHFKSDLFIHPLMYLNRYSSNFLSRKERTSIFYSYLYKLHFRFITRLPKLVIAGVINDYFKKKNVIILKNKFISQLLHEELNVSIRQIINMTKEINKQY